MKILGIGNAIIDVINTVPAYPQEDDELRVLASEQRLGGNCANTLVSLAMRDHQCSWMGTLADDFHARTIQQLLQHNSINTDFAPVRSHAQTPVSWVTLSRESGSRTILHHRLLNELSLDELMALKYNDYDWIHFEGRNVEVIAEYMQYLSNQGFQRFSLEVEKPRENIESLFRLPAVLMFSRHYVHANHAGAIRSFFPELRHQGVTADLYCGWGQAGGWAMDDANQLFQQPAWKPEQVIDTLGAGDVFNAAIIDATLAAMSVEQTLAFACRLAGYKCGIQGFAGLKNFDQNMTTADDG